MPDEAPNLEGRVVSVEPGEATTEAPGAAPARVLVEGEPSSEATTSEHGATSGGKGTPGKGGRYLLNFKVASETHILARGGDGELSAASVEDLAPDQEVEVWHSPETGRSYPAQARALTIIIRPTHE